MDKFQMILLLHLLTAVISILAADERREDLIEDSVRRLLGFKPGTSREISPPPLPPRYMMDLYEKYRSGQTPMQGNTVRSILPIRDNMGEADVLIFNLTSLHSTERILKSELYILKRKRRHGRKRDASHFRMKIGILPNMTFYKYLDVSLSRQKSEWQSNDITPSVLQCRRSNAKGHSLLGITLEVRRSKNNYRLSRFRRLLKQNSQPFLLVFSEEGATNPFRTKTKNGTIQDLLKSKLDGSSTRSVIRKKRFIPYIKTLEKNQSNVVFPINYSDSLNGSVAFEKTEHLHKFYLFQNTLSNSVSQEKTSVQKYVLKLVRSGLPNDSFVRKFKKVLFQFFSFLSHLLKLEDTRTSRNGESGSNHEKTKRSISNKLVYSTNITDASDITFQTVEVPSSSRAAPKNRKRKKKKRKFPMWWTRHESRLHSQDSKKMCQRRSLVVDFNKLGWGDWVMSPKSFNAYYCTGECSYPLIKNTNPSNHAALQSLIHALGLNTNIPSPCCVPSSTRPLMLLYFDEHGSLVLKNYPRMIVEKCACR